MKLGSSQSEGGSKIEELRTGRWGEYFDQRRDSCVGNSPVADSFGHSTESSDSIKS